MNVSAWESDEELPARSVVAWIKFHAFCKKHCRRECSLLTPKENQKSASDFDALEAAGCGSLRLLRALGGTRILQAAAPTTPPCFGRWPQSSPLQTRGCSPLLTPKRRAPPIQSPSVAARQLPPGEQAHPQALRFSRKLSRRAIVSAGNQRGSCRFPLQLFPVKK